MFKDAADAVTWAERYAAKSNVKSQMASLLKKGGGEPVFDIALSITAKVSEIEPKVHGLATKCVYGEPDQERDRILGEMIGEFLLKACPKCGKSREQLNKLGYVTVKAERAHAVYEDRYPLKRMAHDIGISRVQFCTGQKWVEVRSEAIEVLRNWYTAGLREIELWLDEQDWFESGYVEEINH